MQKLPDQSAGTPAGEGESHPGDLPPASNLSPEAASPVSAPFPLAFPPWPIWESLVVLALFTITQILVGLALVGLLGELGDHSNARDFLREIGLPLSLFLSHAVGWGAILWVVCRRHRLPFLVGMRLQGRPQPRWARAALGGAATQVVAAVLSLLVPPPPDFMSPIEEFLRRGPEAVALFFLMAVVMAPPLEEALFRGLLLPSLRRHHGFLFSAVVVTLLFTALHGTQTGTYWPPLVGIALCGWMLAWLRESSGSLWPSIAFHVGFNGTAFLPVLFLE